MLIYLRIDWLFFQSMLIYLEIDWLWESIDAALFASDEIPLITKVRYPDNSIFHAMKELHRIVNYLLT